MKKALFVLLVVFGLTACMSSIDILALDHLKRGMTREAASKALDVEPRQTFVYQPMKRSATRVDIYLLANGDYTANYLLAFNSQNQLIYWGYPSDFARSKNPLLNSVGRAAVAKVKR